jgi:hypothetical protein
LQLLLVFITIKLHRYSRRRSRETVTVFDFFENLLPLYCTVYQVQSSRPAPDQNPHIALRLRLHINDAALALSVRR